METLSFFFFKPHVTTDMSDIITLYFIVENMTKPYKGGALVSGSGREYPAGGEHRPDFSGILYWHGTKPTSPIVFLNFFF